MTDEQATKLGVERVETVAEMLPKVDYLTVHTPLDSGNQAFGRCQGIAVLKPGVRLINCARGGIYDEAALVEGLKNGQIAGRGPGRLRRRALYEQSLVRHARRRLYAALGSQHRRGTDASRRGRNSPAAQFLQDR